MKTVIAQTIAWFFTTVAALVGIGVIAPVLFGMALSGGGAADQSSDLFGLVIYEVVTDGAGGFEAGFGPGMFVCAAVSGLVIGAIAGLTAWRAGRPDRLSVDRGSYV